MMALLEAETLILVLALQALTLRMVHCLVPTV
jgi:hypothetical protein